MISELPIVVVIGRILLRILTVFLNDLVFPEMNFILNFKEFDIKLPLISEIKHIQETLSLIKIQPSDNGLISKRIIPSARIIKA